MADADGDLNGDIGDEDEFGDGQEDERHSGGEEDERHSDGEDDVEAITPAEVLHGVTRAFVNESAAPKLLPHKQHLIDCLVNQVEQMERNIMRQADRTDIKCTCHRLEVNRIQYIVNGYMRVRLRKIEESAQELLDEHQRRQQQGSEDELLDEREVEYAKDYIESTNTLIFDELLTELPEAMRTVPVPKNTTGKERVFIEVLKDGLEEIPVPDMSDPNAEVMIKLELGSRHLIPFHAVEELLNRGDVTLL